MHYEKMKFPDEYLDLVANLVAFKEFLQVITALAHEEIEATPSLVSDDVKEGILFIG